MKKYDYYGRLLSDQPLPSRVKVPKFSSIVVQGGLYRTFTHLVSQERRHYVTVSEKLVFFFAVPV